MDIIVRNLFLKELGTLLNKYSQENGSNTPDFILAEHLADCLETWNKTIQKRNEWYGRQDKLGAITPPSLDIHPGPLY